MNIISKLPALKSRNYRLFFIGQGLSLIGTWMTQVASIWLVYKLTSSAWLLGIVGFTSQIPSFIVMPFAGVLVDRFNRLQVLLAAQILSMLQSFTLAFLTLTGQINIWHIIILSFLQGIFSSFDAPARQAILPELVEQKDAFANAIALNASMFNSARLIGPAIAGLIIARLGAGFCFLIDGISFIAVLTALFSMRLKPKKIEVISTHPLERLKEGFVYTFGFPPIRSILLLLALVSFMGMQYTVLVPIFATKILQGGPQTLGFLMASSGIGALIGAVYLSTRHTVLGLDKFIAYSPALLGLGLIIFSLSRVEWLSLITMFVIGLAFIMQFTPSTTIIQTIVDDDKRGRVMSIYTMAFFGVLPFGNLFAGFLADYIGAPNTLIIAGVSCILGSLIFTKNLPALKQLMLPVYTKLGII